MRIVAQQRTEFASAEDALAELAETALSLRQTLQLQHTPPSLGALLLVWETRATRLLSLYMPSLAWHLFGHTAAPMQF